MLELCQLLIHQNSTLKLQNADVFLPIEIRTEKLNRNKAGFSSINITTNKVRQNDVEFSSIVQHRKNTSKRTWKFVDIFFLMYRRNIDIELTWMRSVVLVAYDRFFTNTKLLSRSVCLKSHP